MAIVEGQIQPLKELKKTLSQKGISRFSSIGEITDFVNNYSFEKRRIPISIERALDEEIKQLNSELDERLNIYNESKATATKEIDHEKNRLQTKNNCTREKYNNSLFFKFYFHLKEKRIEKIIKGIEKNYEDLLSKKIFKEHERLKYTRDKLDNYKNNKQAVISQRFKQPYRDLAYEKEVIDGLYPLIAGAIGENQVVKEIQKLSDNFYLFNDFTMKFKPPIYNRTDKDRIYSIQIDHLLVCESGIYILETKNWSKQSINNMDLRSPIKQVQRTSYALFVLLNSNSKYNDIKLEKHHWGHKQISIKNLIVMIHEKPNVNFKHVKVLLLSELNGYVSYFDPVFSPEEVKSICNYLRSKKQ